MKTMRFCLCVMVVLLAAVFAACGDTKVYNQEPPQPSSVTVQGDTVNVPGSEGSGQPPQVTVNVTLPEPAPQQPDTPTEPLLVDTDGDGMLDADDLCVLEAGTPEDNDGDLLADLREAFADTNPCLDDSDSDLLTDFEEINLGTNPLDPDTDGDGLQDVLDFVCPTVAGTRTDSDSDGYDDGDEERFGSNQCKPDSDGDSVLDGVDPCPMSVDCDGDGINDNIDRCPGGQMRFLQDGMDLNPFDPQDQDDDGLKDENEVNGILREGTGEVFRLNPCTWDTDGDRISDSGELNGCWSTSMNNCGWTSPLDPNTDGDEWLDGEDTCPVAWGHRNDADNDGLYDIDEERRGSNFCVWDTDGDGIGDYTDEYPACSDNEKPTLGRMSHLIVNMFQFDHQNAENFGLAGVSMDHPYRRAMAVLRLLGILNPREDGYFYPDTAMTRTEALVVGASAVGMHLYGAPFSLWSRGMTSYMDLPASAAGEYFLLYLEGYYAPRDRMDSGRHHMFHPEDMATMAFVLDLLQRDDEVSPYDCMEPLPPLPLPPAESTTASTPSRP